MTNKVDIDVREVIEASAFGRFQWLVLALCFAIALFDGYDAQIVGFVIGGMAHDWGIDRSAFGPVFSTGFAGLLIGALIFGSVADKWGRKTVLIWATLQFGLFSLATVFVRSIDLLLALRFMTGLGVGGAVPNAIALAGEYAPRSLRLTMMTTTGAGVSVGAAVAGLAASQMLPSYGWRSLFYVGGLAPLALAVLLVFLLPESLRFLLVRGCSRAQVEKVLRRVAAGLFFEAATFSIQEESRPGFPVRHLFTEGRAVLTCLLWAAFLLNIAALYTLIPWLPTLVQEKGLNISDAAVVASVFSVGGIFGGVGVGRKMDRSSPYHVLVFVLFAGALCTIAIGLAEPNLPLLCALVFFAGFAIAGGQHGANAHAGAFYPTFMRSTGIGWAMGIGRIGSVLGPLPVGYLLKAHWPLRDILGIYAFVVVAAAALFALMGCLSWRQATTAVPTLAILSSSGRTPS
jgi:MFS transporter, AAHS family, 4-hydroxybenzoate transporter